jgi:hypothetical protein
MASTDGLPGETAGRNSGPTDTILAEETLADPRWFPLRFDAATGNYHFAFIPAEVHRGIAFLRDFKPAPSETRLVSCSAVATVAVESAPLHFILHSGLGGSTFVARALAQPGVAVALQEPPILTDVILYGRNRSSAEVDRLLIEVTRLLARPFSPGEAIVCKLSGIGNGVARIMAGHREDSQLLCLQNPLDQLLSAFASRGIGGRMAGRQLAIGLRNSRMFAFEMTDKQLLDHTDFQLAALAWLSIQKLMIAAAQSLGPTRVASISSEQLMRDAAETLSAISLHFRLDLDVDACSARGVFSRHAKTGEPFNPNLRAKLLAETLRIHRQEIEPVVIWARRVAETAGISWDIPYPLSQ